VRLVLLMTAALLGFVWWNNEGYNLADSIEYVHLARKVVDGQAFAAGHSAVRPPLYPALLSPFVFAVDWLAGGDMRYGLGAITAFQALLSLLMVFTAIRLGALVGGRSCGIAAGVILAFNPVFLRYSMDPLSDMAAGIFLAVSLERVLIVGRTPAERRRRGLVGGLSAGLSMAVSFKMIPACVALGVLVLLRDRWGRRQTWIMGALGVIGILALHVSLDRIFYGVWAKSLVNYLIYNVDNVAPKLLRKLGMPEQAAHLRQWMLGLFGHEAASTETVIAYQSAVIAVQQRGFWWYVQELWSLRLAWFLPLVGLGVLRYVRRPRWTLSILVLVVCAHLVVLSGKSSKDFRLWLALLPPVAVLAAYGWTALCGEAREGGGAVRRVVSVGLLLVLGWVGVERYLAQEPRKHGNFWQAIEWIDDQMEGRDGPVTVGSSYEWAVFFRHSPRLRIKHSTFSLAAWSDPPPEPRHPQVSKMIARRLHELSQMEWLILHETAIVNSSSLAGAINAHFTIKAAFFEEGNDDGLGPVYVMHKKRRSSRWRPMFLRIPAEDGARLIEGMDSEPEGLAHWSNPRADGESLTLMRVRYEELPGSGLGWMSLVWRTETGLSREYATRLYGVLEGPGGGLVLGPLVPAPRWQRRGDWPWRRNFLRPYLEPADLRPGDWIVEGFLVDVSRERLESLPGPVQAWVGARERRGPGAKGDVLLDLVVPGSTGEDRPSSRGIARLGPLMVRDAD
jgi:4-amino-4-deoxy-L-arabinose transferase-like glycosyltransferase